MNSSLIKWRERFGAEIAIREAVETEMMEIRGEIAELLRVYRKASVLTVNGTHTRDRN